MYRNLSAVLATLALGVTAASATTAPTQPSSQSLEQRVLAAQKTIGAVMNNAVTKAESDKVAQGYYGYSPWNQWSQWSQWHQYQRRGYYYGY
jgi:hypothetical protein